MLVNRLPGSSATVESQLDDPEYAAWVASLPEQPQRGPRVSDWTPDVARLTDIYDRLAELIGAVYASNGGKPPSISPSPRPKTAVDRLKAQAQRVRHESLVAEVQAAQERYEQARR